MIHHGLKHSKNCRCAKCNTELMQLITDRAYNLMLDSAALHQQRLYIQDVVSYGTGAMKMSAIDQRARHCAIHGCPFCERRVISTRPKTWFELQTERRRARARIALVLGVLALLVILKWWN